MGKKIGKKNEIKPVENQFTKYASGALRPFLVTLMVSLEATIISLIG